MKPYSASVFPLFHVTIPELSCIEVNQAIKNTLKLLAAGQTSYQLFENMLQLLLVTVCRHAVLCCTLQTWPSSVICQSMLQDLYSGEAGSPVLMSTWYSPRRCLTHYNYNSQNTTGNWYHCTFQQIQQSRVPGLHRTVARTCLTQSDCEGRIKSSLSVLKMETRVKFL